MILQIPDATLFYDVRGSGPLVVLVGAPMDADAFAPLAKLLAVDHTVLTTDPRGIHRSLLVEIGDSTPEMRADDLARLISHVDAGPAAVFGSSGGAVTALALAQTRPELAHTVIAHEPPLEELLDDRDRLRSHTEDMVTTYLSGDRVGAWRKFLAGANIDLPEDVFQVMFAADPEPQQADDERFWFVHEMRASTYWLPDLAALRDAPTRIVVGVGKDSAGEVCDRTSRVLAAALGVTPTPFPGGHTGFVDDPAGFAPRLRGMGLS